MTSFLVWKRDVWREGGYSGEPKRELQQEEVVKLVAKGEL